MKKIIIATFTLVIIFVLGGLAVMTMSQQQNPEDEIPLSERRTITEVDRDVLEIGESYRAFIDERHGPQEWDDFDAETYPSTYSSCTVNGEPGKTVTRQLGTTLDLSATDYPEIQEFVASTVAEYGWTKPVEVLDDYELVNYYYAPDDTSWFHLGMNKETEGVGLTFYGSCYQSPDPDSN